MGNSLAVRRHRRRLTAALVGAALALTSAVTPAAAAGPQPLLSFLLYLDDANPNAITLGSTVELESYLQKVLVGDVLPVHYRFGVTCYGGAPANEFAAPDRTVIVPPPPPNSGVGPRVPIDEDVVVPWDCVTDPRPLTGFNGYFWLRTGGGVDDYSQMALVLLKIKLPDLATTFEQVRDKYGHAKDFGITLPKNPEGIAAFDAALKAFVAAPDTLRVTGTYAHQPNEPVILNYNPTTLQVVIQHSETGQFISGWKMSPTQLHYVRTIRRLGGSAPSLVEPGGS